MQLAEVYIFNSNAFPLGMQEGQGFWYSQKKSSDYYPFGLTMPGRSSNSANPNDNYKFTGYEKDNEAGLDIYHANARGYDPVLGRFNQIDPRYELYPGWTTYQYGLNNPLRYTDPTGECIKELPCPKFIENLKNKAVQVNFSGKLTGGFQFSANVERFEGFTANAGSIELANFEGSTELSLTDEGIQAENTEVSGELKGKGDDVVVSQEAGLSLHGVGGSLSHDFSFNKDGITSQQTSGSLGAGPLNVTHTENLQTGQKTETTALELGVKGAFILGIEINVSIKIDERDL